jgi:hypothetical protein
MAKLTLLDMVQDILSDMSSDNVNSIADTAESERVAAIIKSTFFKMVEEKNWPHIGSLLQLTALGSVAKPSHMQIPTAVRRIEWLKYDQRTVATDPRAYTTVEVMKPLDFMEMSNNRDSTATNIDVVTDFSGNQLNIRNDSAPTYYTSFDGNYIVFDSFDSGKESTLTAANTQSFGFKEPVWGGTLLAHTISRAYALNDIIAVVDAVSGLPYYYRCSVPGTTAGVAPTYSIIIGTTVVDGTASFVVVGTSSNDAFIPDVPAQMFPMFLARAKTQCFNKIKQVMDSLEDRDAKRQGVVMQKFEHKNRVDGTPQKYGWGRK